MKSLALAALVACGGAPAAPPPAPRPRSVPAVVEPIAKPVVRERSVFGDSASTLPLAIVSLTPEKLDWRFRKPTKEDVVGVLFGKDSYSFIDNKKFAACANPIIDKVKAYFRVELIDPGDPSGPTRSIYVAYGATVDEVSACLGKNGDKRKKNKNPRIAEHMLLTFTQLRSDWFLVTPDTTDVAAILATESETPNPLGALTSTRPTSPEWTAVAKDYSWEIFGVRSVGAVFEYEDRFVGGQISEGPAPFTVRIAFDSAETAKTARARVDKLPDKLAEQTAFGELIPKLLTRLRAMKPTVEGTEIVLRATMKWDEWSDVTGVFSGAPPVRRPLTRDEERRLFRPLPVHRN